MVLLLTVIMSALRRALEINRVNNCLKSVHGCSFREGLESALHQNPYFISPLRVLTSEAADSKGDGKVAARGELERRVGCRVSV